MNIEEIKAREKMATPGPWDFSPAGHIYRKETGFIDTISFVGESGKQAVRNCAFIAHARTDIPELIAEVERLQKQIDEQDEIAKRKFSIKQSAIDRLYSENATMKKALELACERIAEYAFCGGTNAMKQKHAEKNIQHFIQQAQEQEVTHAK